VNANVIRIHPDDSVAVGLREIRAGETLTGAGAGTVTAREEIMKNHKVALRDIPEDAPVIKYGEKIGRASRLIRAGEWVHTHNLKCETEA
jgi:altronate hydrolase